MNIVWEKLYFRIQALFVFLQKKMLQKDLQISGEYRIDLLRTLKSIKGSIRNCDVFVDIGANKGEFAEIFSDIYKPSTVICVEPNEGLNGDIKANNPRVPPIIINKAVSDRETEMTFYFHTDSQMSSLFPSDKDLIKRDFQDDDAESVTQKVVPVTTLDAIFNDHAERLAGKTVFLKIDTQGNELEVIKGGATALRRIQYCLLEYMFHTPYEKQYPFESIMQLMNDHGFSCLGPMHASHRAEGEVGAVLFLFGKKGAQS